MTTRSLLVACAAVGWLLAAMVSSPRAQGQRAPAPPEHAGVSFQASNDCMACHNGLTTPSGEDVSIGVSWRSSMMANSSRDPYWHAAVRRETLDHPEHAAAIEDECSICHMPMARTLAHAQGLEGRVFANVPGTTTADTIERQLAADGVSCTVCHQISDEGLGTPESFVGGFVIQPPAADGSPSMFGPFEVTDGHAALMRSATGVAPTEGAHIRSSELCATCHTLITESFDADGNAVGSLPEQVPYQEWQHSAFIAEEVGCQSCHMPTVSAPMRVSSVLGEEREGMGRHTFVGGNFFMLRMLNRYRDDLGVQALPAELEATAAATVRQLQGETATVTIEDATRTNGALRFDVAVTNRTGHKLPTAYPSRRAWLHVTIGNSSGQTIFESGRVEPNGAIVGNDNDADPSVFEPHYEEVREPGQVQIYEAIIAGPSGALTTGLLTATQFVKDNRLLPRGFVKATAGPNIAVHGTAAADATFDGDGDRVRYVVDAPDTEGPLDVEVELRYQPIGFRWAQNLSDYRAPEPERFIAYYDSMAASSSVVLVRAVALVP